MTKQTLKQAGYVYIRNMGKGRHLLENIRALKPYSFEVWFSNKNHASYGLIYKNTHLEFASSYQLEEVTTDQQKMDFYLEWFNDFLTVERFAEYHMISDREALSIIQEGKELYKLKYN